MKKMEKTAGEKPGKDAAIRKDAEASAEKIVIKTDPVKDPEENSKKTKQEQDNSGSSMNKSTDMKNEKNDSDNDQKSSEQTSQLTEKGKGLKSSVEGKNPNSPLPADDDGTIVL